LPGDATTSPTPRQRAGRNYCDRVAWVWRYENAEGQTVDPQGGPAAESFPTQADAETWIGETWRELLEAGVDAVTLLEDGREVYGPMSLHT
jgi:hypothetical protein